MPSLTYQGSEQASVHAEVGVSDAQLYSFLDPVSRPHHHLLPLHPVLQGGGAGVREEREGWEDPTPASNDLETVGVHNP